MIPMPRSRRARRLLWLAFIAALVGLLAALIPLRRESEEPTPLPTLPPMFIHSDPAALTPAAVTDIIDGDTIDVRIDGTDERVRYYGIDAPERDEDCYEEASARNRHLVGSSVLLLPDARERDPGGRLLRYVFTPEGQSIEAQIIAEGLGRAWRDEGAYRERFLEMERQAREDRVGCLWQEEE
ncbi:MAG: thermonuclease family protein [Dehalococcoidia bacterium]